MSAGYTAAGSEIAAAGRRRGPHDGGGPPGPATETQITAATPPPSTAASFADRLASGRGQTRPCGTCGDLYTLDTSLYATAVHDCDSGDWSLMPREVAEGINSMTDQQLAEWCGLPIAEIRRLRRNIEAYRHDHPNRHDNDAP